VDARRISLLPERAYVFNVGRGKPDRPDALAEALQTVGFLCRLDVTTPNRFL
jgi:phosphoglycerate dehydrogenase-like enzyme